MYKLIVVDDRKDVLEGITKMFDWKSYDIEIVGKAMNGVEALELIRSTNPHIIITDIRMPKMDGLELTEQVKNINKNIKVIILSGYDEFDYAQEAIRLGAEAYLLKPLKIKDIAIAVKKVKGIIEEENHRKKVSLNVNKKLMKSLPLLIDAFFHNLLMFEEKKELAFYKEQLSFLDISLQPEDLMLFIVEVDHYRRMEDSCPPEELDLIRFCISNVLMELVEESEGVAVFSYGKKQHVVLINANLCLNHNQNLEKVYLLGEKVLKALMKYLELSVTISIGPYMKNINELHEGYTVAANALAGKLLLGNNRIIPAYEIEGKWTAEIGKIQVCDEDLLDSIYLDDNSAIEKHLERYLKEIFSIKNISPEMVRRVLMDFISRVFQRIEELKKSVITSDEQYRILVDFHEMNTYKDIREWLSSLLFDMSTRIANLKLSKTEKDIQRAKAYIAKHYNQDISLAKTASHVALSQNYFSTIFKEYVGMSFVDYLIAYKMEKAKDFLRNGDYKVYEVANMVGYSDRRYFSDVFRKFTDMTPAEYAKFHR